MTHVILKKNKYSPYYVAPEIWESLINKQEMIKWTKEMDVYAFGIMMCEILTGERFTRPWSATRELPTIAMQVARNHWRPQELNLLEAPDSLKEFVRACWSGNPSERPSFAKMNQIFQSLYIDVAFHSRKILNSKEGLEELLKLKQWAASVWSTGKSPTDHRFTVEIEFELFLFQFCKYVGVEPIFHTETEAKILKNIFAGESNTVNINRFATAVRYYTSPSAGAKYIRSIREDFEIEGW